MAPSLNTLAVGHPLVGSTARWSSCSQPKSQYPRSWASPCWGARRTTSTAMRAVSIPSQLGIPLLGSTRNWPKRTPRSQYPRSWASPCWALSVAILVLFLLASQYPRSWASPCWGVQPSGVCMEYCLNTLAVGHLLVGRTATSVPPTATCLNTLAVGHPLVGESPFKRVDQLVAVSIPSQLGIPLLGSDRFPLRVGRFVSIPSQLGIPLLVRSN